MHRAHAEPAGRPLQDGPAAVRSLAIEFEDTRLLLRGQSKSTWLHLAGNAAPLTELPLVVFLHGLNPGAQKHLWVGGARSDLRGSADKIAKRSGAFLLAAPSQTKEASSAKTLWSAFDLTSFVGAVGRAASSMGVRVAEDRVFLVGHSGAGCSGESGIFTPVAHDDELPRAIVGIDTCLDEEAGRSAARTQRPVWLTYQDLEWPRNPNDAMRGFLEEVGGDRFELLTLDKTATTGPDPHNAMVPAAFERIVGDLLGTPTTSSSRIAE